MVSRSRMCSIDEREQFWLCVMHFDNAPLVGDFQRLTDAGRQLLEPDTMNDEQQTATQRRTDT
jgi:hypothetical protein